MAASRNVSSGQPNSLSPPPPTAPTQAATKYTVAGGGAGKTGREKLMDSSRPSKRRCVSNACIACRRRKSKCDGNSPACAACASVYHTECVYDPNSDHRRKGVYKKDIDNLKTQNSTLQTLVEAILNYPEDQVYNLVRQIRTCDSLEELADAVLEEQKSGGHDGSAGSSGKGTDGDSPDSQDSIWGEDGDVIPATLEAELSGKMGALRLEEGQVRFIGATSNLILIPSGKEREEEDVIESLVERFERQEKPITTWTTVTQDPDLIAHLISLYFTYHYPFFTTLSKDLFYKEFLQGVHASDTRRTVYCTPLLVNIMLSLGCHFTTWESARANPKDSATAGDHFFKEAKRLILEHDEHETPRLTTVQALALMSVREAGCGRESKGWVYSGMSFRMALDLGLHLDPRSLKESDALTDEESDARRVTFWGCFLFDKCWSNYMGRMPQLPSSMVTVPKPDVFPSEDSDNWVPYTDSGISIAHAQPSRIRAIARQISLLCEISNDILLVFYNPTPTPTPPAASAARAAEQPPARRQAAQFKKLAELFTRLEDWRKRLPAELDAREKALPSALLMHMFHQTLYIHLFRPFLKYSSPAASSPSPNNPTSPAPAPAPSSQSSTPLSHLDPRKSCLAAATTISKYLRFYKRRYSLRAICNVAGYFVHSAVTIHLLNPHAKTAARDIAQGLRSLEEMGECWLVARRALVIIDILVRRWGIALPADAEATLARGRGEARRFGLGGVTPVSTPSSSTGSTGGSGGAGGGGSGLEGFSPLGTTMTGAPRYSYGGIAMFSAAPSPQSSAGGGGGGGGTPGAVMGGFDPAAAQEWWLRDGAETLGVDLGALAGMEWDPAAAAGAEGEAWEGQPAWGEWGAPTGGT